ncbi:hypothetical protein C8R46DRAFT_1223641 [Mycena filopes]|nr:hypothetical protein C8R46DRAFT_1223641 [Mycena filopes]
MSPKSSVSSTEPGGQAAVTGRTLVLCFDGTAGQYDGYNTNAVKLFALLKKNDFREQLCYYQPGIGTYLNPSMVSPVFEWCAKVLDEAFAIFLNDHVGLLPRDNQEQIPFAFKMYQNTSASGIELAAGYKQTFCQTVQVDFMGVWDTVSSVGVFMGRTLPFTSVNTTIKTFRHAVSLDEHRVRFMPYLLEPKQSSPNTPQDEQPPTDALECWFSGCHSDIGGGNVKNDVARSLSDITLRWMVRQVVASNCGILFEADALKRATIPGFVEPASKVAVSPEAQSIDDADSSEPMFDTLAGFSAWKALEILPLTWSLQDVQGGWHRKFGFHLGKGRPIVDPKPNFHVTVKERMANTQLKYRPKAQWVAGTEVYIE